MMNKLLLSAAIVAAGSSGALAQGFSGAELGIEYSNGTEIEDVGGVSYYGSVEFAAGYGLSVALDASAFDYDVGDADINNITAHVIYNVDQSTAIGGFFGQDSLDDATSEIIGAEFAYDFGLGDIQGYLGSASDSADNDVTLYGASASYMLGSGFSFSGAIDGYSGDDFSASALEIGGYYQLAQGPRFGATLGRLTLEEGTDEEDATYFGLQASVAVGPNGGTTFGRRGAYETVKIGPSPL